uniref:T. congolense-specific, cell surface-expressed gene family n=1 Tax=Trypanosoma congolense (strain IL3000) TaxID=1068625 RepID=G0UZG3_TRYCI|nr:hypothetical protein, unlikely [Trypanosoma congolense IL3000]
MSYLRHLCSLLSFPLHLLRLTFAKEPFIALSKLSLKVLLWCDLAFVGDVSISRESSAVVGLWMHFFLFKRAFPFPPLPIFLFISLFRGFLFCLSSLSVLPLLLLVPWKVLLSLALSWRTCLR